MTEFGINMTIYGSGIRRVLIGNAQNMGARPYQEDSFGFTELSDSAADGKGFMAIVADGMGGLTDSGQISSYAVDFLIERFKGYDSSFSAELFRVGDENRRRLHTCSGALQQERDLLVLRRRQPYLSSAEGYALYAF